MSKQPRKNFASKPWVLTSTDENRPALNCLYFDNGMLFATNGNAALVQDLDVHAFTEDEKKLVSGKFLHRSTAAQIAKHQNVFWGPDKITCISKDGQKVEYIYTTCKDRYPNIMQLTVDVPENQPLPAIGVDMVFVEQIMESFVFDEKAKVRLGFTKANKAIWVTACSSWAHEYQVALIMPVMLGGNGFQQDRDHPLIANYMRNLKTASAAEERK